MRVNNGHGVTTSLPATSDAVQVRAVKVPFAQAPSTQSGGPGGNGASMKAKGKAPRTKSVDDAPGRAKNYLKNA